MIYDPAARDWFLCNFFKTEKKLFNSSFHHNCSYFMMKSFTKYKILTKNFYSKIVFISRKRNWLLLRNMQFYSQSIFHRTKSRYFLPVFAVIGIARIICISRALLHSSFYSWKIEIIFYSTVVEVIARLKVFSAFEEFKIIAVWS